MCHRTTGELRSVLLMNPHFPPPKDNLALGLAALEKAKSMGAKTQRERDYIETSARALCRPRQSSARAAGASLPEGDGALAKRYLMMMRRRSPTRSRSTLPPHRTTRPMPTSSRGRPSSSRSSAVSRDTPEWPIT